MKVYKIQSYIARTRALAHLVGDRVFSLLRVLVLLWAHTIVRLARVLQPYSFTRISLVSHENSSYARRLTSRALAFLNKSWENTTYWANYKLSIIRRKLPFSLPRIMSSKNKTKQHTRLGHKVARIAKHTAFFSLVTFFVLGGIFFAWVATLEIPQSNIDERVIAQSTKVYDSTGEVLLYDVYKDERRTIVPLEEISPYMQKAIMAIEDDQFYEHNGVRFLSVARAIYYKLRDPSSRLQGGSTITQQVIKNALLNSDRKIERKVKEWVLAWRIEKQKSKEEIMEIYLNEIPFGGPVYGVEQAARSFFNKTAVELTVAESAYLAALPKAPTTYLNDREKFDGRARYIMERMNNLGFITQVEYNEAVEEEVVFQERDDEGIKAPHFVFYTLEQMEQNLTETEGELHSGGYEIETTLNWEMQQKLQEVVEQHAERVSTNYQASNLAVVVIENKTGKVRAMIGSKDYFAEDIDGKFNVTTAQRQPGSTFKPFVYANAFSKGYTPDTVLWDTPTEFSQSCFPDGEPESPQYADACYMPSNYDKRFRGPLNLRSALAQSLNVPAVKLLYLVGVGDSMNFVRDLGITTLNKAPSFYGLNLVLGGGEVRMVDMASAYSTFANEGVRHPLTSWQKVVDAEGELINEYEEDSDEVMNANVARMVNDILSDNDAKRPMFGARSPLYYENRDVAVKTGTTNSFKDVWTAGYSSDVTVVVWAGNNDNTPISSSPSSSVVGPFWRDAMDVALGYYESAPFRMYGIANKEELKPILRGDYEGGDIEYIDPETGEVVENLTEEEKEAGIYEPQGVAEYHSILHYINRSNVRGPVPTNPEQDGLYEHFEYGVSFWTRENNWTASTSSSTIDQLIDDINEEQNNNQDDNEVDEGDSRDRPLDFSIVSPQDGLVASSDSVLDVEIDVIGNRREIDSIYYYFNNTYLGSNSRSNTSFQADLGDVRRLQSSNTLKVIIETTSDRRIEKTVSVEVQ